MSDTLTLLTEREKQVLLLVANGKTDKQIAEELYLSVNTIKTHLKKIYRKLDVSNRIQASNKVLK